MYTKCLKYRILPTSAQETALCRTLATCRDVYNSLLNERKHKYEVQGASPSRYEQQKHFPQWAKEFPEIRGVFSQVLQNVAVRLDIAFTAFFRRVEAGDTPGFPRVKGEGYDSFTYPQAGFQIHEQAVSLSKIGIVKAVLHRPLEGRVKTCTVRRQGDKWYVCFAVEVGEEPLPASEEAVGIDVGLNQFAALSNGEMVANPRFFRKEEKALAKAQRKLSKQKRGTRERRNVRKVVRLIHERIAFRRHDFVHQTARISGCATRVQKKLGERVHYCPTCGLSLDRDTNAALNILNIGAKQWELIGMGQHTVSGIPE